MAIKSIDREELFRLGPRYFLVGVLWLALLGVSLAINIQRIRTQYVSNATATARANIDRDMFLRKWVASHGGIYVEATPQTPPNPFLSKIKERDIKTPSGRTLTLMNPAYALREVLSSIGKSDGVFSHITSLKTLNPDNQADPWERSALQSFEAGEKEVFGMAQIDGKPYFRLMRPFYTEDDCLKCHREQGYKVGDVRGGISTSVSMLPFEEAIRKESVEMALSHAMLACIGLIALYVVYRRDNWTQSALFENGLAIQKSNGKLKTAYQQTKLLLDSSLDAIVSMGADNKVTGWNGQAERILGYSKEEAIGKFLPDLIIPEEYWERHHRGMARFLSDGHKKLIGDRVEITARRADNKIIPVELAISCAKVEGVYQFNAYIRDISERKEAESKIEYMSLYDQLTGLPNRKLLKDRIATALAAGRRLQDITAVLYIDLDFFKLVNESHGQEVGDSVLKQISQRILSHIHVNDTLARVGGDEFILLLNSLGPAKDIAAQQAESVACRVMACIREPVNVNGVEILCKGSIGISFFPDGVDSVEQVLINADSSIAQAKDSGRDKIHFHDPLMQKASLARLSLENQLRSAVPKELALFYQPQVDRNGLWVGAEALVRWYRGGTELVSPVAFIPLAESTGLIYEIGRWVMETACQQLVLWSREHDKRHLSVAVNVSAKQFMRDDFVAIVQEVLHSTGVDPSKLKLELTESMLVEQIESTIEKMRTLRKMGIRFSLDDFGTGFSSLSYLKALPLNQLKIDKSFVDDVTGDANNAAIVRTIIGLGQSLGLEVIAEGVEDCAQQAFLAVHGCPYFQGYLFGKPMPIAEFNARVR